jgi:hypothetical protein
MTPKQWAISACAGAAMLMSGAAQAENWLDTRHTTLIDGDSIRKESDGLVHFMEKDKYPDAESPNTPREGAVDCAKRIWYSSYDIKYTPDWRSKGEKVIPGTMGEQLLEFVCSRVR